LFILFKTRNWDALRDRLPIVLCGTFIISVALNSAVTATTTWQMALGVVILVVFLAGTVLPAASGLLVWIRRHAPARLWAAYQLTRGRLRAPSVSLSLIDGVGVGAAAALVDVVADLIGLRVDGHVPSISREVSAVGSGLGAMLSEALATASLVAIGIAIAVEVLDSLRLRRIVSTLLIALVVGVLNIGEHRTFVAALPSIGGQATVAVLAVVLYRARGLLAVWISTMVSELLIGAAAARSLDDPDLVRLSSFALTIAAVPFVLGIWGIVAARLNPPSGATGAPASAS
jgi:hypothetical protein